MAAVLMLLATGIQAEAKDTETPNTMPRVERSSTLAEVEARRKALFQKMMADPANLDVAFEYATLSSRAGDLESAVSTLERMLIFAPDVPRLQLELGVLYYRLGSYQLAEGYLTAALDHPHVPPAVRAKVEPYLTAIRKRTAIDRFDGTVTFGARYQSNANGGASSDIVHIGGFPLTLNDAALADPDANAFISGNFRYSHELPSQGDSFDVHLLTYGALYADHHEINTGIAELTFGPVFSLGRFGIDDANLSLYGILGGVALDGDPYRLSGGAGMALSKAFTHDTSGQFRVEYRYEDYRNSDLRPTASDRTGNDVRVVASLKHQATNRLALFASIDGQRHDAEQGYRSNRAIGGMLGASYLLDPPIGNKARPWTAALLFGALGRHYDEPAPTIFGYTEAERDTELFVQGSLTVPLRESWALQAVVGYRNVDSNYDIDTFDNVSASLGISKSF